MCKDEQFGKLSFTIVSEDHEENGNYVVQVMNSNGYSIRVLIPKNPEALTEEGETYGLNMVTEGHYA